MTKTSKLVLIVAIAAVGIASPVLAQSRDNGRDAFAMVPQSYDYNSPALTGGGSIGYNADLPQHTD